MRTNLATICAVTLVALLPSSSRAGVVTGPTEFDGIGPSAIASGDPGVSTLGNLTYTFLATSTSHFMQIEINENGQDTSVAVTLDFFQDLAVPNGVFDGGDGGAEDLGLDYAAPGNPDFSGSLLGDQNQDVFEWFFTGLTQGQTYGVRVSGYDLGGIESNGPELIRFSAESVAIPEASSFLFGGVACAVAGAGYWRRRLTVA